MLFRSFIVYVNVGNKETKKKVPKLAKVKAKSHILGNTYSNKVHNFRISLPTKDWKFKILKDVIPLQRDKRDINLSYLAQMQHLLRLERYNMDDRLAWVEIGIVPLSQPRSAEAVARDSYIESFLENEYRDKDAQTLQKPSAYASGALKSAYYVITSPVHAPYDTLAVVFLVRDLKAYIMVAKVKQKDYDTYKWDFEKIFNSFSYLIE